MFSGLMPQPPRASPSPPKSAATPGFGIRTRNTAAAAAALRADTIPAHRSPTSVSPGSAPAAAARPPCTPPNGGHVARMRQENAVDLSSAAKAPMPPARQSGAAPAAHSPRRPAMRLLGMHKPTPPASVLQLSPCSPPVPRPSYHHFRHLLSSPVAYASPSPPRAPAPSSSTFGSPVARREAARLLQEDSRGSQLLLLSPRSTGPENARAGAQQAPAATATVAPASIRHTSNTVVRVTKDQQLAHLAPGLSSIERARQREGAESDANSSGRAHAPSSAQPQSKRALAWSEPEQGPRKELSRGGGVAPPGQRACKASSIRFREASAEGSRAPPDVRAAGGANSLEVPPHGSARSLLPAFLLSSKPPSAASVATSQFTACDTARNSSKSEASDGGGALLRLEDSAIEACDHQSGYSIGETIGQGGFCQVKLGVHEASGQQVAIKIIDKEALKQPHDWRRVGREVRILKRLKNHPAIIHLYDVIPLPSKVLLVQELAQGGSLLDFVRNHKRLTEDQAMRFFLQIVAGLQFCHSNEVVHRDIKLENLLMDTSNNMKIIDFGLAAVTTPGKLLKVHCGSPSYAAPEIVGRHTYEGPPADVWSLGVVTFAMVSGYLPFHSRNGRAELSQKIIAGRYTAPEWMSDPMKDLLSRMLAVDPAERLGLGQVWSHPWVTGCLARGDFSLPRVLLPLDPKTGECVVDATIVAHMTQMGACAPELLEGLQHKECNHLTATYLLLAEALHSAGTLPALPADPRAFLAHEAARKSIVARAGKTFSLNIRDDGDLDDESHFAASSSAR